MLIIKMQKTKSFGNFEYLEQSINLDKYVNGEYDKDKTFTENPGYVPYSLEMPDYLELNFC